MRTLMIARRVGVVIVVLGAVMALDFKGTASAQTPPAPQAATPQAAAQAAPQDGQWCGSGYCQPITRYYDYYCPSYYPVPYPVYTPIYNIYRRVYYPSPYYVPYCSYYNVYLGDYPPSCPGGNCGPYYGGAPAAPASTPQAR